MNLPAPTPANLPLTYTEACKAVAQCWRVDECKGWADKAAAVAAYAKMVQNVQLEADAKRIRLRATRRIGEIIGSNGWKASHTAGIFGKAVIADEARQVPPTLRTDARAIARIPQKEFESFVESSNPPVPSILAKAARRKSTIEEFKSYALTKAKKIGRSTKAADRLANSLSDIIGAHVLLDFLINRQPARNLLVGEVLEWAKRYHQISGAFILLLENHDRERRVGDCVDGAMADQALAACKKVDSI